MLEVWARELCGGSFRQWSALASSQSLWEKPICEGVWPYLDPMDSVCLRTASMEWNVPGKYGTLGELFFFLIKKEPATMPGCETLSPFVNADIRTPLFSADVLKKCACRLAHDGGRKKWRVMSFSLGGRMGSGLPKESNVGEWRRSLVGRRKCVFWWLSRRQRGQRTVARHRVVWAWWQDLSFPARLGAAKGAFELPHGPGHAVPGNARGLVVG